MTTEHLLGWALVHSVWEISAIAGVLFLSGFLMKRANIRYVVALGALALCLTAPFGTALLLNRPVPDSVNETAMAAPAPTSTQPGKVQSKPVTYQTRNLASSIAPAESVEPKLGVRVEQTFPMLLRLWLIGLVLMCLRLCGGYYLLTRLKQTSIEEPGRHLSEIVERLARRLGISRPVQLMLSSRVETPSVIGVMKTVILFPASALVRLSPSEVEAIIAHELAHVRRHDYLVNVLQSVVEAILFFHPAVWWISSVVRSERENCCDDLAISATGDRPGYAKALLSLEGLRAGAPRLAVAASGGSLLGRIRRLAGVRHSPRNFYPAAILVTILVAMLIAGSLTRGYATTKAQAAKSTISGQILTNDYKPASGAVVFCRTLDLGAPGFPIDQTVADRNGKFTFSETSHRTYNVSALLKGHGMSGLVLDVDKPSVTASFRLHAPHPMLIRVRDSAGKPVSGMKLAPGLWVGENVQGINALMTESTDSKGVAVFQDLPGQPGLVDAFSSRDPRYAVSDGPPIRIGTPGQLTVEPACQIEGRVTIDGRPVPNAIITSHYNEGHSQGLGETNSDGEFLLTCLHKGFAFVTCNLDRDLQREWAAPDVMVELQSGKTARAEIKLVHGALIHGRVVDSNGKSILQPFVNLWSIPFNSARPDPKIQPDGSFEIRVPAGSYDAFVLDPTDGTNRSVKLLTVRDGETSSVVLQEPSPRVHLSVLVLDSSRRPAPNVHVDCYPASAGLLQLTTNKFGIVEFDVEPSQARRLFFSAQSGEEFSPLRVPRTGDQTMIQLHKVPLGSVTGIVLDPNGRPRANAKVDFGFSGIILSHDGDQSAWMGDLEALHRANPMTGPDGRFRIDGLFPGSELYITVRDPVYAGAVAPKVEVLPGNTMVIPPLHLAVPGDISGRVVDQGGKPIANARVFVENSTLGEARTDKDGRFHFTKVAAGVRRLGIFKGWKEVHPSAATGSDKIYRLKLERKAP
jgi:beta-lactamase regulating signal transducer with metallopeptidase domain